jgi:hypothetical protein
VLAANATAKPPSAARSLKPAVGPVLADPAAFYTCPLCGVRCCSRLSLRSHRVRVHREDRS